MSYEYSMGMGQFRLPRDMQQKLLERVREKIATRKALSPEPEASGPPTSMRTSQRSEASGPPTSMRTSQRSSVNEREEAGDRAAQEAIEEAAQEAEEVDEGDELETSEEEFESIEETEPEGFKMPIWGWVAIGGGSLLLLTGVVAIARRK